MMTGLNSYLPPNRPGNLGGRRSNRLSRVGPAGGFLATSGLPARRLFSVGKDEGPGLRGFGVLRGIGCTFRLQFKGGQTASQIAKTALLRLLHCQDAPLWECVLAVIGPIEMRAV